MKNKKYYLINYRYEGEKLNSSLPIDIHPFQWLKEENEKIKAANEEEPKRVDEINDPIFKRYEDAVKEIKSKSLWKRKFKFVNECIDEINTESWEMEECEFMPYINFIDWKELSEYEYRLGMSAFGLIEGRK